MTTTTFGHWLKQRRKALGLTQKSLAQVAGCAEVTLRKIESGDLQPSAPLVTSLAGALAVDDADLPTLIAMARGLDDDFTAKARLLRPQRPNNLPAQLTPLIGRAHDISVVRRRLLSDGARLVTLVGPPGVGKTRLALAAAEDVLDQFNDGVFFVRLAPVSDPDQVAAAIAQALGLQMSGPNPPELQLRAYLEEKHLLLVLDNFEQIVAAAPLVDDLLRRCPWLHVLVTSRQPLRVRGERQVTVQPLALPASALAGGVATAKDMLRYPAVELFADRAEAVLPDLAVDDGNAAAVAELCRRLDGLPLAIELVAARVKLLPPNELLTRLHGPWLLSTDGLRDVSARQKTLRGAIGWSYDLLSPDEQMLFTYLSVCVGGFTLEAAELLCGDTLPPPLPLSFSPAQILDGIGSLLDKNLLYRETGIYGGIRYTMLETVREYGLERLTLDSQATMLREKHARCFLQIAESADQEEINPRKLQLNRFIDDEIHNLRAALDWFKEHDVQAALTLSAPMTFWLYMRGPLAEGKRLIEDVLALPGASTCTIGKVKALAEAGLMMYRIGTNEIAWTYLEESLEQSKKLGYDKGEADALMIFGVIASETLDYENGRNYLEAALAIYKRLCDPGGVALTKLWLAQAAYDQADYSQALALAHESVAVAHDAGFSFQWPRFILANILFFAECELDNARSLYEQILVELRQQHEAAGQIAGCLVALGEIATRQGDFAAAQAYLDQGLAVFERLNPELHRKHYSSLAALHQAKGDYVHAASLFRAALPATTRCRPIWAYFLLYLAALVETVGRHELAAMLLGTVDTLEATNETLTSLHHADYQRVADAARSLLGNAHFDVARAEGQKQEFMTMAERALSTMEGVLGIENQRLTA